MKCRNALILFIFFIIFSFAVCNIGPITTWDTMIIMKVQALMHNISSSVPIIAGGILFYIMLLFPFCIGSLYLLCLKLYRETFLYAAVPFVAYFINSIVKGIAQRPRPSVTLQLEEHMTSTSYVSRHTFLTACLWSIFVYIVFKYCENKFVKYTLLILSVIWILFEGFSRVWLGVHNPTDVIGAYILACVFVLLYIRLIEKISEKN